MLNKVWTNEVYRMVMAAYSDEFAGAVAASRANAAVAFLQEPGMKAYKVENQYGAFVGFYIADEQSTRVQYIRPHMRPGFTQEFLKLISETLDNGLNFSLQSSNFNPVINQSF